jgi:hypothetical protein
LSTYIFVPADLEPAKILGTSIYGANVVGITGTLTRSTVCARRSASSTAGAS